MIELTELTQKDFEYDAQAQAVIDEAVKCLKENTDRWLSYQWTEKLVKRGTQIFAVFPFDAREVITGVLSDDNGLAFEYRPMVVDGKMVIELPDEGRCGVAHLIRRIGKDGTISPWHVSYISCGWLRIDELQLPARQIAENIANEIDAGASCLTGKC